MPDSKNITIHISTVTVLKVIGILLVFTFVYFIRDIVLLLFVSLIFAAIIEPIVSYFETKKIPRGASVGVVYVCLLLILLAIIRLAIPPITEQFSSLVKNFPDLLNRWSGITGLETTESNRALIETIEQGLQGLQQSLQQAASGFYAFTASIFRSFVNFIIVLTITFYITVQKDGLGKIVKSLMPDQYYEHIAELSSLMQTKIGSWVRAQLILAAIVGLLTFVTMMIFLPKYALVLALIAAVTELIPYIGPIIGAVPAVFLGFTVEPISFLRGVAVLIVFIVIQQLESVFFTPQIMKHKVGLHPVVVIVAMLIGARLAGIIGVILAIPVATAISVIVKDFWIKSDIAEIASKLSSNND